jgi:hypothetical protein
MSSCASRTWMTDRKMELGRESSWRSKRSPGPGAGRARSGQSSPTSPSADRPGGERVRRAASSSSRSRRRPGASVNGSMPAGQKTNAGSGSPARQRRASPTPVPIVIHALEAGLRARPRPRPRLSLSARGTGDNACRSSGERGYPEIGRVHEREDGPVRRRENISSLVDAPVGGAHPQRRPSKSSTIPLVGDRDRARRRARVADRQGPGPAPRRPRDRDSLAIISIWRRVLPAPDYPRLWPADRAARARGGWPDHALLLRGGPRVDVRSTSASCPLATRDGRGAAEARGRCFAGERARREKEAGEFCSAPFSGPTRCSLPPSVRLTAFRVPTDRAPLSART